ncbi:MAG: LuxR family transcriptional regulator [Puniceicoccaceae bacterium]|nr:MAG: LuxR family transcriptional regulator [Puniceicoccaceae bacterium]
MISEDPGIEKYLCGGKKTRPRLGLEDRALLALAKAGSVKAVFEAACSLLDVWCPVQHVSFFANIIDPRRPQVWMSRDGSLDLMDGEAVRRIAGVCPGIGSLGGNPGAWLIHWKDLVEAEEDWYRGFYYNEVLKPMGLCFAGGLAFWDGNRLSGFLGLLRDRDQGDFGPEAFRQLGRLHAHLEAALGRVLRQERQAAVRESLQRLAHSMPTPCVMVDWTLETLFRNKAAEALSAQWNGGGNGSGVLPRVVLAAIRRMRAEIEADAARLHFGATSKQAVVESPIGDAWKAEISPLALDSANCERTGFLVRFRRGTAREALAADPEEWLAALTLREREVACLAALGTDNREIARRLGKSVPTVKRQLHSTYRKLGIASRARLIAILNQEPAADSARTG